LAFAPDGKILATADLGQVIVWDVASGKEIARFAGHKDRIVAVAFSPSGRLLVTASWDGTVKLWRHTSSRLVNAIPERRLVADRLDQLLEGLIKSQKSDKQIADALYLATLARFPTEGEMKVVAGHLEKQNNRREAFANVLFALTQSREFTANVEALNQRTPRKQLH
jgi:hypothetical protein